MEQQDIKEILIMLKTSMIDKDWEGIADTIEQLKEYLDEYEPDDII